MIQFAIKPTISNEYNVEFSENIGLIDNLSAEI